jgi:hypothetical protein
MKHHYRWAQLLLTALLLLSLSSAQAQQAWRPFRPGLIYSYVVRNSTTDVHTLRVDSVYWTTAGDSVYTFNRLMRRYSGSSTSGPNTYVRSRNNLFGARMRWVPGQPFYWLECDAQANVQAAASLRINPRAAVGQTWVASTSPLLTAIMQARSYLPLPNSTVQDSVVTIEIRTGTATTGPPLIGFSISQNYGLLEATPWLGAAINTATSAPLVAALPAPLSQTPYSPLVLFAMQPGDELGYHYDPFYFGPAQCQKAYTLRRILTRQQRADSLVFTYQEQMRSISYGYPFCGGIPAANTIGPITHGRLAISLQTGRTTSYEYSAMPLLTGEYKPLGSRVVVQGLPLANRTVGNCGGNGVTVGYQRLYPTLANADLYYGGLDGMPWQQHFSTALGLGALWTGDNVLIYYRRTRNSVTTTCGSPINFMNLLPTRAAQAAAVATLAPNPATESATLTLAQPARTGTMLRLTDALGRQVWSAPVAAGQTAVAVPLAGQPVGMYLLHLDSPDTRAASWKLVRQ